MRNEAGITLTRLSMERQRLGALSGAGTNTCKRCERRKSALRVNFHLCESCAEATGSGTLICQRCFKYKEPERLGSDLCRACSRHSAEPAEKVAESKPVRSLRTTLPIDVWGRLSDEAQEKNTTLAALVRDLIVARDARRNR